MEGKFGRYLNSFEYSSDLMPLNLPTYCFLKTQDPTLNVVCF